MLNWISSKLKAEKSDHPLASDAAIATFLDNLTPGRPETNLREIVDWLGDPQQLSATLAPEPAIRAIVKLDEAAEKAAGLCWEQFLNDALVDHLAEQKLKTLDSYYQAAYDSYRRALQLLAATPAAAGSNLAGLNGLFAQRAIHALVGRLRILHIRYRAPDPAWWNDVGTVLTAAHEAGVINLKQRTYPDAAVPASTWVEFLLALFFEIAPLGNLVPQQMDLLYRLIRWLEPHFMVQSSFGTQSPYYVLLNKPAMPAKAADAMPADPNLVYFGPGLAYGQLVRLRSILKQAGALPDWMNASQCPFDKALQVIDSLIMHWSERPPERRFKRERREAGVLVVNSFSQIRRMIAFSEFARSGRKVGYKTHLAMLKFERFGFADTTSASSIDEEKWQNATPLETVELLETSGDKQMMDDWTMQDVSEKGLGVVVPFLKPWMLIGTYIGFRLKDEIDWRIGILRRIHRVKTGHPAVGIETLQDTPRCAQILPLLVNPGSDPWALLARENQGEHLLDAVVLSMAESRMLIPNGVFQADKTFALVLSGSRVPVRLKNIVHHNADCDCVQYEICEQAQNTGESSSA